MLESHASSLLSVPKRPAWQREARVPTALFARMVHVGDTIDAFGPPLVFVSPRTLCGGQRGVPRAPLQDMIERGYHLLPIQWFDNVRQRIAANTHLRGLVLLPSTSTRLQIMQLGAHHLMGPVADDATAVQRMLYDDARGHVRSLANDNRKSAAQQVTMPAPHQPEITSVAGVNVHMYVIYIYIIYL
jgi:hypothetical protein